MANTAQPEDPAGHLDPADFREFEDICVAIQAALETTVHPRIVITKYDETTLRARVGPGLVNAVETMYEMLPHFRNYIAFTVTNHELAPGEMQSSFGAMAFVRTQGETGRTLLIVDDRADAQATHEDRRAHVRELIGPRLSEIATAVENNQQVSARSIQKILYGNGDQTIHHARPQHLQEHEETRIQRTIEWMARIGEHDREMTPNSTKTRGMDRVYMNPDNYHPTPIAPAPGDREHPITIASEEPEDEDGNLVTESEGILSTSEESEWGPEEGSTEETEGAEQDSEESEEEENSADLISGALKTLDDEASTVATPVVINPELVTTSGNVDYRFHPETPPRPVCDIPELWQEIELNENRVAIFGTYTEPPYNAPINYGVLALIHDEQGGLHIIAHACTEWFEEIAQGGAQSLMLGFINYAINETEGHPTHNIRSIWAGRMTDGTN